MRLLIVDDEVWSRQLIKKILPWVDFGFNEIMEAGNGVEAIEIYKNKQIDLTITDMRMPGIDGAQLLQYIRNNDYNTEVIVMSGYEDYKYLHEALKTKAIDYLLKPVVKQDLIKAVHSGIDRINENLSYTYIEEILEREDLKHEFNKYYEIKNSLYKGLSTSNEVEWLKSLEVLEKECFQREIDDSFTKYILADMSRFIIKIYKDYMMNGSLLVQRQLQSFAEVKESVVKIAVTIKESRSYQRIDLLEVQKYIDNHFTETISLTDIADIFHVSKEYLSRLFKKEVGISVQNYVLDRRINYSKKLLKRHNSLSISTISVMSGYTDLQYYYRVFKNRTGMTPVAYRNTEISI